MMSRSKKRENSTNLIDIFHTACEYSERFEIPKLIFFDENKHHINLKEKLENIQDILLMTNIIKVLNCNMIDLLETTNEGFLLLNMASENIPGGGVKKGSNAQEEFLCRISNLYPSLLEAEKRGFYPFKIPCISKDVVFFRDENYEKMKNKTCDIINAAAHNVKKGITKIPMEERIKNIIDMAINENYHTLILSAFGCGAYGNDPKEISLLFYNELIINQKAKFFKSIYFAIFGKTNNENLKIFQETFKNV